MNGDRLALAGLAGTAIVAAAEQAHKHTPPMSDVAASQPGTATSTELHRGGLTALVTAAAIGAGIAIVAGHPAPLLGALVAAGAVLALYEWHLRH